MAFEIENGVLTKYIDDGETSVTIPDSVTSIGKFAFYKCKNLTEIKIPDSLTSIGDFAFYECKKLTEVKIPDFVTSIGDFAFYKCSSLKEVKIPDSVTSIGEYAFGDTKLLEEYPDDFVIVGNGILIEYKGKDEKVTIPDSVTSIGWRAFYGCESLTELKIPDSVMSIDWRAFDSCKNLIEIKVSENNATYSDIEGVLFNKEKTELLCYPCGKIENSYIIPDSVTGIGENAFKRCENLTEVKISDSVTSLGKHTFCECSNLEKVIIPDSVTSIDIFAFDYHSKLKNVTITIKDVTFKFYCEELLKDYDKSVEMLKTKNFSVKIYQPLKNAMIIGHFLKTGDEDAEAFIKKGCLRIFKWLIDEENIPIIYALLNMHIFVNAKNIDKIFEYANHKNNAELKLIFMNYKHEHIGMTKKKALRI